jgi:DNA-directed RNA polymerase specialized sigma24 family protein
MATERLSMRKTREILRLKWLLRRSHREIQRAVGVDLGTVSDATRRRRQLRPGAAAVRPR